MTLDLSSDGNICDILEIESCIIRLDHDEYDASHLTSDNHVYFVNDPIRSRRRPSR